MKLLVKISDKNHNACIQETYKFISHENNLLYKMCMACIDGFM